jgi:curved DNA-binding protein CbpA
VVRQRISHYEALGVERDASTDSIRAAFRKLAREQHPDRFQGEARRRAEERFQEITEAFNILSRPDSREKYDRELFQGGGGQAMDRREIARRLANKGAQSLRDGKLPEAVEDLRLAIDHDDDCSRAHYFMGIALGRLPDRHRDALRHLERATALEPQNPAMLGEAAAVCLKVGMRSRAERMAREALDLDPTNVKATQVLEEVGSSPADDGGDGLLGRLRKRG